MKDVNASDLKCAQVEAITEDQGSGLHLLHQLYFRTAWFQSSDEHQRWRKMSRWKWN